MLFVAILCGVSQALAAYVLAAALGGPLCIRHGMRGGVLSMLMLGSAIFLPFSLLVACLVKTRERFMGIDQVLTMPLFFASNAIYPLSLMPDWLHAFAIVNALP